MRLREIGRRDDRIPEVFIDGIYGKETQNAVRELQKIYGLRVTGAIDLETLELINRLYEDILRRERIDGYRPKFDNYEGQVMSPDDVFDDIFLLQLLLRELSLKDDRFFVEIDGRFNPQTVIAVKLLQSILGKEQDGKVDRELWNSLVRLTETTEGYL
jgi:peptidoglycan hydrolase-like protein with peptidoglycan-binding domain